MRIPHHISLALLKVRPVCERSTKRILLGIALFLGGHALAQLPASPAIESRSERAGEVVFVAGVVTRQAEPTGLRGVEKGQSLREGDLIKTEVDGYVYVRMADGGLLVVRPLSELHIDKWRFDPNQPQLSEIRYTLKNGVARYVSGKGSQAAKDKFRFNTPIAAIGVRGTDFTVFSDPVITRVIVHVGGVVVSRFGTGCRVEALGPCEGDAATELFASAREKMIQIRQGDLRPELVDINVAPSPDKARPPAPSEPVALRRPAVVPDVAIEDYRAQQVVSSYIPPAPIVPAPILPEPILPEPVQEPVSPPSASSINAAWARIGTESGSSIPSATVEDILKGRSLVASNRQYALAVVPLDKVPLPNEGSAEFKLVSHQGVVVDKVANQSVDSIASNGYLRIDFVKRLFTTGFDLQAKDVSAHLEGYGTIGNQGKLFSKPFQSPMLVQGIVGGPAASEAIYIYQQTLSKQFDAAGVASWGK